MNLKYAVLSLTVVGILAGSTGCNQPSNISYTIGAPDINHVEFSARLVNKYGIGASGSFPINNLGTISMLPETNTSGFGLDVNLDIHAFLPGTWAQYQSTGNLPTGIAFPAYMGNSLVDVSIPKLDTNDIKWHFYFGVGSQRYVGVASVLKAVGTNIPAVNLGYVFYNKSGNVVLGIQFFGAELDANGALLSNGGLFIGTDLTPLLPAQSKQALVVDNKNALRDAIDGTPVTINGESVTAQVTVSGRDAAQIKTKGDMQRLLRQYIDATQVGADNSDEE